MMGSGRLVIIMTGLALLLTAPASAGVRGKIMQEIFEKIVIQENKLGGEEVLERLIKTYGDDVLKVVDDAGFEFLEEVPRYGDEIIEIAMKASPQTRRVFAQNIPELLPLVRRVGTEALELEAKSPGLAVRVFKIFGDDAGKVVARNVPAEDIPRLLKYAEKADSPETRKALVKLYEKEGKNLFKRIPAKLVLAAGLSASMLYGTHELTVPVRAIGDVIDNNAEIADTAVRHFFAWSAVALLAIVVLLFGRFGLMPWQRPRRHLAVSVNDATGKNNSDQDRIGQ